MHLGRLVAFTVLGILPLEFSCAQQSERVCKKIEINSAGTYCLDPARVLGVAPGSGGSGSVANYVRISPPVNSKEMFSDVSKIILMGDANPTTEPRCEVTKDATHSCAMSVAGKKLKVIVYFRPTAAGRIEERTRLVAKDVSQEVIK